MNLVFVDTETTGLDPTRHQVWELAYAIDSGPVRSGTVYHSLANADPTALRLNGYFSRASSPQAIDQTIEEGARDALKGATLVAANPAFDAAFLRTRWGVAPWHHRLWDIEAYAAGVLGLYSLKGLAGVADALRDMGHAIPEPDHSAGADVTTLQNCFYTLQNIRKARA